MRRYEEIMDNIEVTEEIYNRILRHIQELDLDPPRGGLRFSRLKRYVGLAACFAVLLAGAIALPHALDQLQPTDPPVQVVPNIVSFSTAGELSDYIGFQVSDIGELPFLPTECTYTAFWRELAEIKYEDGEQAAVFRKSVGEDDNSGSYDDKLITEITVGTLNVTLKGDGGICRLAVWTDGGYSYSLRLSAGMTEEAWSAMITAVSE